MKKALLLALSIATLPLSSCDLIFGATESYMIENVATATDNLGNTIVTIAFMDDARPDFTFTVPTGAPGENGAEIKDVTAKAEGEEIVLTITYTDATKEPTILRVPNRKGEDGRLISKMDVGTDEEGNTTLLFTYSDGTTSDILILPNGKNGENATHLISNVEIVEEDEGTRLLISFLDSGEVTEVFIPDGKDTSPIDHVEIQSITHDSLTYLFVLADGTEFPVTIPYEAPQQFYLDGGEPSDNIGTDGDFYLNRRNGDFYTKENGTWTFLVQIEGYGPEPETPFYFVRFDPNGGVFPDGSSSSLSFLMAEGSTLPAGTLDETIGIPTKDNGQFVGWHTTMDFNPNSGRFDDSVAIHGNLTLYAWYNEI